MKADCVLLPGTLKAVHPEGTVKEVQPEGTVKTKLAHNLYFVSLKNHLPNISGENTHKKILRIRKNNKL